MLLNFTYWMSQVPVGCTENRLKKLCLQSPQMVECTDIDNEDINEDGVAAVRTLIAKTSAMDPQDSCAHPKNCITTSVTLRHCQSALQKGRIRGSTWAICSDLWPIYHHTVEVKWTGTQSVGAVQEDINQDEKWGTNCNCPVRPTSSGKKMKRRQQTTW